MQVRFDRVTRFLAYLNTEEENEHHGRDLAALGGIIGERIVPGLIESFGKERLWIEGRLQHNRERVAEDIELISESDTELEQVEQAGLFDNDMDETEKVQ